MAQAQFTGRIRNHPSARRRTAPGRKMTKYRPRQQGGFQAAGRRLAALAPVGRPSQAPRVGANSQMVASPPTGRSSTKAGLLALVAWLAGLAAAKIHAARAGVMS